MTGPGVEITPGKRSLSGRKERSNSHVGSTNAVGGVGRRQSSIATIGERVRAWWSRRNQAITSPTMIPQGLSQAERRQYETLVSLVAARLASGTKAPQLVVITDLAKDYDDLAAMVVLKEFHRLGVVKLLGFVANLMPATERTRFGRGALDLLDLQDIPIAAGTSGFPDKGDRKHEILDHEFNCDFMADAADPRIAKAGTGEELLHRLLSKAVEDKEKVTVILISSLEDIYTFSRKHPDLFKAAVGKIILQGGYSVSPEGHLIPDEAAANNRYDMEAAIAFHKFVEESKIASVVYTKVAAFATPLTSELFAEMAKTRHPLGVHLRKVQVAQDLAFYRYAMKEDPKERFVPFMDQEWFLRNKTSWYDKPHEPGTPLPDGDEVVPYLDKVVIYDALAAVGSSGADALDTLKVLTDSVAAQTASIHRVVGVAGAPSDPGIHPEQMATVLSALLKGSLLTTKSVKR